MRWQLALDDAMHRRFHPTLSVLWVLPAHLTVAKRVLWAGSIKANRTVQFTTDLPGGEPIVHVLNQSTEAVDRIYWAFSSQPPTRKIDVDGTAADWPQMPHYQVSTPDVLNTCDISDAFKCNSLPRYDPSARTQISCRTLQQLNENWLICLKHLCTPICLLISRMNSSALSGM